MPSGGEEVAVGGERVGEVAERTNPADARGELLPLVYVAPELKSEGMT